MPSLALSIIAGVLIWLELSTATGLVDRRADLRIRGVLGWRAKRMARDLPERAREILQLVSPPSAFARWVDPLTLERAGWGLSAEEYRALWWLAILAGSGLGGALVLIAGVHLRMVSLAVLIALTGVALPYLSLRRRLAGRARQLTHALPDFLDLLTLTVEAGMGFEPALRRVAARYAGPLGEELRKALRRMQLGYGREDALQTLVEHTGSSDVQNFVSAVVQSERLGTSLARTMRIQAELLRARRLHRARASAQTAPVRIIPALVFFFLPALLLIYLAPPILTFLFRR